MTNIRTRKYKLYLLTRATSLKNISSEVNDKNEPNKLRHVNNLFVNRITFACHIFKYPTAVVVLDTLETTLPFIRIQIDFSTIIFSRFYFKYPREATS